MSALACLSDEVDHTVLKTALQPIVALHDQHVFAFEALTRMRLGRLDAAQLFDRAMERRRGAELNLAAIHSALDAVPRLPQDALLFINADPVVLGSSQLSSAIRAGAERNGFSLSRLVLEITERSAFMDVTATTRVLGELRGSGVRFALDDFGSAHSHLAHIDVIRPSFIKIGHSFGTAFEGNATHTRIVRHISSLARDFACSTILEGVESPATARAARELGIEYAQGYQFGRPVAPSVQ